MINIHDSKDALRCSSFSTAQGAEEFFLIITSDANATAAGSLADINAKYEKAMQAYGLSEFTQVFNRVYLSDIENQIDLRLPALLSAEEQRCHGHPAGAAHGRAGQPLFLSY